MCSLLRLIKTWGLDGVRNESLTGEMRNAYKISVGKPEGKRLLERCSNTLDGMERNGIGWIHLIQDNVHWGDSIPRREFLDKLSDYAHAKKVLLHGVTSVIPMHRAGKLSWRYLPCWVGVTPRRSKLFIKSCRHYTSE